MTPARQRKHDRITWGGASANEIAADFAAAPFDRVARDYERKWGIDRLPELAPPEMAAKFGKAVAHLNACLERGDVEAAKAAAENAVTGLHKMDAAATAAGHAPLVPEAWEVEIDGTTYAILRDMASWPAYEAQRPGVKFFSMREAILALLSVESPAVAEARRQFPGAEIAAIRKPTPLEAELDDTIPF